MKIKMCNICPVETAHRSEPFEHLMSAAAAIETCAECGFESVVIPQVDTLSLHVKAPPQHLKNGVLIINDRPASPSTVGRSMSMARSPFGSAPSMSSRWCNRPERQTPPDTPETALHTQCTSKAAKRTRVPSLAETGRYYARLAKQRTAANSKRHTRRFAVRVS